jgi:SRSO17 transposase
VDHRLYLLEEWFDEDHQERWERCAIPEGTTFKTKPALALEMIQDAVKEGHLRFQWVTCDEAFGRDPVFLDGVADLNRLYLAEVPYNTCLWQTRPQTAVPEWSGRGPRPSKEQLVPGEPKAERVDKIAVDLKPEDWHPYVIKEGSKGPMVAEFAFRRGIAVRNKLPGPDVWIVFRRSLGDETTLKVYLSNAPAETPVRELVRRAGLRWPVETAIQECKDGLGMDHYEVRSWLGWHHHMTECLLAHHFLVRCQQRLKKGLPR